MLKIITILTIYLTISSSSSLYAENKSIDSKNEILLKEKCSSCHSLKMIYQQRLSKSRWEEIILNLQNMRAYAMFLQNRKIPNFRQLFFRNDFSTRKNEKISIGFF